jgi:hypothetical protein
MPYHPNIPLSTDDPTISQGDLLDNFGALAAQFGLNHVSLTAGANQGYHTQVWFAAPLGADPNLTAPQSSVYTKTITNSELFFQNTNIASGVSQLTNLVVSSVGNNFGFYTPWGLTFNLGKTNTGTIGGPYVATFTGPVYVALLTNNANTSVPPALTSVTNIKITYTAAVEVYYLVIGKTTP